MEVCPYCGKECETTECGDSKHRHYCDVCDAMKLLDDDEREDGIVEKDGWILLGV